MNKFIKDVIEEKFASKRQQRFFYAQAGSGTKRAKKWAKWAKEFSDDTDFEKLPEKVEKEVDEIVDSKGNIARSKKPTNLEPKTITSKKDTNAAVDGGFGMSGSSPLGPFTGGKHGYNNTIKFWGEGKEYTKKELIEIALDKVLGAEKTMLKSDGPEDIKTAEKKITDLVGDEDEAEDRLEKMGYDKDLPKNKFNLIENPRKFIEEYLESILGKKSTNDELVKKSKEIKEVSPIIKRQLSSLKQALENNGLTYEDVLEYLKSNEQ